MLDQHNSNWVTQPLSQLIPQLGWDKKSQIIAICGAGGKTSLMHKMGSYLSQQDLNVLLTTTTKIYRPCRHKANHLPDNFQLITDKSNTSLAQKLRDNFVNQNDNNTQNTAQNDNQGSLTIAALEPVAGSMAAMHNKLCGISTELPTRLIEQKLFDIVIVEADGAARKPLKAPSGQEPIIPTGTNLVIGLSGWEGLSQPISNQLVHRLDQFCQLTGLAPGEYVSPNALEKLILSPEGLFQNRPPKAKCCWLINQADNQQQQQQAAELAQTLATRANDFGADWLSVILAGSLQQDALFIR
ncbi:selenium cofactor biosynthesis protein YqeC [Pelagibaculum spongiae]|uniref:Putative selenium-dependent hydroxylase accessory protein YqeC n=1 Tax=Pelagibaculum spongiae TaxID=2080658 RepID=A0A2V1GV96_9GAMM|nr:selenium cofactor biosynthesis protein YqeC [Pelagibaculum spongiae]PVZ69611.1 putative selenium-dependent hydroxylase accessory protein YqeC [Pelagibaculum spongiae]